MPVLRGMRVEPLVMGLLAALVGFGSSFAVVLAGLRGVGATPAEAAAGLTAASLAMGVGGLILAIATRLPIAVAWSTPGAALLATSAVPPGGYAEAVGAFVAAGVLLTLAALARPLGRAVAAIPLPIASAMLAGVLLPLALAPVRALGEDWRLGLPIVLAWLVAGRLHRLLAVPAALVAFVAVVLLGIDMPEGTASRLGASLGLDLSLVRPVFRWESAIGLGVPLAVVTMASQNIPGLAVQRSLGYAPPVGLSLGTVGALSLASAPFGSPGINLAAITAAMCAGPEAGADPARRYVAVVWNGLAYVALALVAGTAALFVSLAPASLIEAVAGLALVGTFAAASVAALSGEDTRLAAAVTFLLAAGGISIGGVGGAFWGLLAGLAIHALDRAARVDSPAPIPDRADPDEEREP